MAQVFHLFRARASFVALALLLLFSACSNPVSEESAAVPPPPETTVAPPPPSVSAEAPAPESPATATPTWDGEPLGPWTVANRLSEFHVTWTEAVALSAHGPAEPDGLVPYADAVTHQGESWGLSTDGPDLVLVDTQGHAYRYVAARHGLAPVSEAREPVDHAVLSEWGWAALESGEGLTTRFDGTQMEVLGALRAEGACATCHDGSEDRLLGALRYTFHEIADD